MNAPRVSVVIATQGRRDSFQEALSSALSQSLHELEIVVVDDSPRAGSRWKEASSLAPLLGDPRVRVIAFNQSRGCAAAKNAGVRAARGTWVCYLDDDNFYRPEKVAKQLALAEREGAPLVLCGIEFRASGRRRFSQVDYAEFTGDDLILKAQPDTNVLFHRRSGCPNWDEQLRTADDACFFHAVRRQHGLERICNVPEALVVYKTHTGVRANSDGVAVYRGNRRLLVKWSRDFSKSARRRLLLRLLIASEKYRAGRWEYFARLFGQLWKEGGRAEVRPMINAIGVKIPLTRRWMVR